MLLCVCVLSLISLSLTLSLSLLLSLSLSLFFFFSLSLSLQQRTTLTSSDRVKFKIYKLHNNRSQLFDLENKVETQRQKQLKEKVMDKIEFNIKQV